MWFGVIVVLFFGFFILEGFDFGVGMLMVLFVYVGMGDLEIYWCMVFNIIGLVWDGNEVWLIIVGVVIFVVFFGWYVIVFFVLYLLLLVILFGMILCVVVIEWCGKIDDLKWWIGVDFGIVVGFWLFVLLWGVVFVILVCGFLVDVNGYVVLLIFDVFNVYILLGGLVIVGLFLFYGVVFIVLKIFGLICDDVY